MSFLKQLLTPFVDFEDEEKKKAATKSSPAPGSGQNSSAANAQNPPPSNVQKPSPANVQSHATASPSGPSEPVVHPLVTKSEATIQAPAQVSDYSPAGTITGAMPEHKAYFEKLIADANASNPL